MEIRLKLIGALRDKMPPEGKLSVPDNSNIHDLLRSLDIPEQGVQVVSVNKQFEHNWERTLQTDEEVTVLPSVLGG